MDSVATGTNAICLTYALHMPSCMYLSNDRQDRQFYKLDNQRLLAARLGARQLIKTAAIDKKSIHNLVP